MKISERQNLQLPEKSVDICIRDLQYALDNRTESDELTLDVDEVLYLMEHLENLRDLRNAMEAILK